MSTDVFHSAGWYRALTLEERAASSAPARRGAKRSDIDHDLARRELESWRSQVPFDRGEWFARRLALDGLDEKELLEILGEPIDRVRDRTARRPDWLAEIEHAYRREPRPIVESFAGSDGVSTSLVQSLTQGVLDALEPLVRDGRERLRARVAGLARGERGLPFDRERAGDLFLGRLLSSLHDLVERVFVLELNVARMQGELEGEHAAERFESFVRRLRKTEHALALLAEYPLLARRVVETIASWERASFELLEHLCADWTNLWAAFSPERDPGRLVRVFGGAGDAHRGGRSVAILELESGLRIVYKPRSLAVDAHFQELLAWLNELERVSEPRVEPSTRMDGDEDRDGDIASDSRPRFRTLRVLDRRDHGWVEFVEPESCASLEEVRRFYWRQGAYLALLHALDAVDFHFENLIAAGQHPMLVDLETLFHPRLPQAELADTDLRLVREATQRSVLRTGLLPNRFSSGDVQEPGVDVSGLGGDAGQLTPDALLHWQGAGTDEMHAARKRAPLPAGRNLPVHGGRPVAALDHVEDLVRGFEDLSRLLMRHRAELAGSSSPKNGSEGFLARFAHDEVRVVLRPTRAYGLLLSESTHPDFLRDALELERFLDKLWVGVDDAPHMVAVIGAEHLDLACGDIPFFSTRPAARDLWDSRGECLANFLPESGLASAMDRLRSMREQDVERQVWFIRSAFATSAANPESLRWPSYRKIEPAPELPSSDADRAAMLREKFIGRARQIGDRLEELALRDAEGNAAWIGFKFEAGRWQLVALPDDLYSGIPGVVHFLAYLGSVTNEARYTALARAALAPLRARVHAGRSNLGPIGAFNGLGGLVYGFAHWSVLWNDPSLLDDARRVAELAAERIDEDEDLDIVGGAAGFIGALASLQKVAPRASSARWLDIARRAGDRLMARAVRMDPGIGWRTRIEKEQPATGFSHGASGMAWALMLLHRLTGEARYREFADECAAYEASQFDVASQNWLDPGGQVKKTRTQDATLMVAWCYGAPGIGMARLAMLDAASRGKENEARIRSDLEIAVRTTRARGFGRNHSLCHGDLGNLDFLSRAALAGNDTELARFVQHQAATVLASIERDGVLCGMPLGIESVALMNGLAGVGFGLLRLAEPGRVPSVLALDEPEVPASTSDGRHL